MFTLKGRFFCLEKQFKMLNKSKGRAVWGPRAQVDKKKYSSIILGFKKSVTQITRKLKKDRII